MAGSVEAKNSHFQKQGCINTCIVIRNDMHNSNVFNRLPNKVIYTLEADHRYILADHQPIAGLKKRDTQPLTPIGNLE